VSHTHSAQRTSSNDEVSSLSAWHRCRFRFWCYTVTVARWKFAWRPICVCASLSCWIYGVVHNSSTLSSMPPISFTYEKRTYKTTICSSSLLLLAVFFYVKFFKLLKSLFIYYMHKGKPSISVTNIALILTRFVFESVQVQVVMWSMPKRKSIPSNEIKQQILRSRCNCSRCTKLDHSQLTTTA